MASISATTTTWRVLEAKLNLPNSQKKLNYHAFGINFHIQSQYNKLEETNYHVLKEVERNKWRLATWI